AQAGADLIVLPELFNVGYTYDDSNHERAEPLDGPTSTWMRETARKFNLHLAGSIMLLDVDEVYNALLLFAPDGRVWRYDKIYPWGWERGYFRSGRDVTVAKTGLGRIGMLICWDTGHRGLWQRYAGQVDLILISSCPPDITNPTYRFPDGRTATFADMGPLRSIQNTGRHLFGDMINEQTAWLGVPAVASVGAGRITTRLPQAKASVASMIVLAPWLARYLPVADQIKMSCDLIHGCKVVDARGNVLTEIPQGEGDAFTLAEVTLPEEQPTPAGPQPPTRLQPFSYFTSDYLFPWLTIPVYRKGLRQVWGPQMAPIEASTRLSTILTVTFGLQMMRLLLPLFQQYLRDSVGVGSLTLAPIALGLFAFGFLAAGVRRLAGTRRALWITSGGLAVVRVLEQFSTSSPVDFGLSALGVVLFLWYVPVAVGAMRGKGGDALKLFGLSFLLGVAFDTALFGALGTLDLSWRAGAYPIIVVVFLAVVLFAALRDFVSAMPVDAVGDAPWGNALALLALGPWLFLQMLIVQNLARTAAVAGWVLPAAVSATIAGNVIGIAVAQLVMRSNLRVGVAGLGFGAVLLVANQLSGGTMGLTGGVLIFVSAIVSPALFLLLIKATEGEGSVSPGLKRLTVMHATGQMLFVMLTFLYYVSYDIPLGFRANVIPPIAGMLVILSLALAAARWQKLSDSTPVQRAYPMIAVVFLAAPLILWLG
ncbi:MAG: carbon-nitrogen hydrolase family protein, partial [Anaerolineales bacterium]